MQQARVFMAVMLAVAASLSSAATGPSQEGGEKESFTALAIAANNLGSGAGTVLMEVTRWSPEAERTRLVDILREKGQDPLLEELRDNPPVGTIRTPDSLAYDLRYAQQTLTQDGGREILLMTDRPIGFWEARDRPRSFDYPFTVIRMQMDGDGRGTGTITYATRISATGKYIILEDFATSPIRLTEIKAEKRPN